MAGDGGYPYAVPPQLCVSGGTLFFHCAKAGHKLDALRQCSKASFCVIDQDQVVPRVHHLLSQRHRLRPDPYFWRTRRRNKLPFGSWRRNTAPATARSIARRAIRREAGGLCLVSLSIEHMTGKQAIELVQEDRRQADLPL